MKYTGQLVTGDFEDNTMTFEIDGEMILQAGKYEISQIEAGKQVKNLGIANVSSCLSIEEVASKYGQKIKCKWLSPDGNDWLNKEMTVNASFLKEMEQGSIKDCC
jgi:hypothetical protein